MNFAQAIYKTENGWAWKELSGPSELARLAFEYAVRHAMYRPQPSLSDGVRHIAVSVYGAAEEEATPEQRTWSEDLVDKVLKILRAAGRAGEHLGLGEICERSGSPAITHVRELLQSLCLQGLAQCEGENRGRVYWADEE